MERRYRLHRPRAVIDPDAAASMTLEEHRHGFAAAMAALVAEFNTYLDQAHADPTEDKVGYRQIPLWLSQDELAELISQIRRILMSKMDNQPAPGRRLHLLSPIVFPIGKTRTTPALKVVIERSSNICQHEHFGLRAAWLAQPSAPAGSIWLGSHSDRLPAGLLPARLPRLSRAAQPSHCAGAVRHPLCQRPARSVTTGTGRGPHQLGEYVEADVVEAATQAWLEQGARLARTRRAVALVEEALRGRSLRSQAVSWLSGSGALGHTSIIGAAEHVNSGPCQPPRTDC